MSLRYALAKNVWKKCGVKSISINEQRDTFKLKEDNYTERSFMSLNSKNSGSVLNIFNSVQRKTWISNYSSMLCNACHVKVENTVNINNSLSKKIETFSNIITQKRTYSDKKSNPGQSSTEGNKAPDQQKTSILSSVFTQDENTKSISEPPESNNKSDEETDNKQDGSDEKDEKKKDNHDSAFLRSQRYAKWVLLGSFGLLTPLFIINNGQPKRDDDGEIIPDEYMQYHVVAGYIRRAWGELNLLKSDIIEPSFQKLLPDPLQEPYYQPPYTLVIELMDVLLRPVYDSVTGWRFKKRPGIEYFLSQIGPPHFEIVIFTRETGMTAYPLIDSMDSKGYIMYRLFRDAARYKSGFSFGNPIDGKMPKLDPYYQKDLTFLNRDLSKVVMVDCDKRAFEKQPNNGFHLEKWDGSSADSTLYDLADFLQMVANSEVKDVRPVLKHYSNYDDPLGAFKQAQVQMQDNSLQGQVRPVPNSSVFATAGNTISSFIKRR